MFTLSVMLQPLIYKPVFMLVATLTPVVLGSPDVSGAFANFLSYTIIKVLRFINPYLFIKWHDFVTISKHFQKILFREILGFKK